MQSYKEIFRLNSTPYFIMKTPNNYDMHYFAFHHPFDINFDNFIPNRREYTNESYYFWANKITLSSDHSIHFSKIWLRKSDWWYLYKSPIFTININYYNIF